MAASRIVINDLRGGRNDMDPPQAIGPTQCVEASNVDWYDGTVGRKRGGSTAIGMTFSSGGPFTSKIHSLVRYVPGVDESAAELWAADGAGLLGRLAGATTWVAPTVVDTLTSTHMVELCGVGLGGFLHLGYDTTQNRPHVWDSALSVVRRSGLATPDPPTVATMGGAGLTFTRYYRIRTVDISGSDTRRRSEASTSVSISITDDQGVTVTRPTLPANEYETHWEVEYADTSSGPWYRAAQVATATGTYSDTASTISTTNLSASVGINTPLPSFKYAVSDDSRLVMGGCWETSGGYTTPKNSRVWWTPRLGSTDVGDAERVVFNSTLGNGYLDVEDAITGIGGPIFGAIYVFGYRRIWKLIPTGSSATPYQRITVSKSVGCVRHQTITVAEDETGSPALYFLSHLGPCRIVQGGVLQRVGSDTSWIGINLAASQTSAHAVYHGDKRQWWLFVATGSSNTPDVRWVFHTDLGRPAAGGSVAGGWAKHNSVGADAYCSVLFSSSIGSVMGFYLKPYIGNSDTNNTILCCDTSATSDNGTTFRGYLETREFGEAGVNYSISEGHLTAVAGASTVAVSLVSDYGLATIGPVTINLAASGTETRTQKRLEGLQTAGVGTFRVIIGDADATTNTWTIDSVVLNVTAQESRG